MADTTAMIANMSPRRIEGTFVFATSEDPDLREAAIATMRETEGMSLILPLSAARAAGLDASAPLAWIALDVHSALDGVGLTAAVADTLAGGGIACNIVAGHHHDHIFVPERDAERAVELLRIRAAEEAPDA
ncbi:hypothetical protein JSE7799_00481 [Jannaschia seosinensis]|uniref:Uncharacterized protein n=1 Tax=Jannaschia seosinensis TaxID=313367 RepID=A0A0M7B721_9RHOB|nr:ACT domain-containing protein [Jannaschia seosinensis]CUH19499.1 hypothetical protein JSE7799_00481 [Jannaschia seosinensis]